MMALGDYVKEDEKARTTTTVTREWGHGIAYTRVVSVPLGKLATELASPLAIGSVIPARLNDGVAGGTLHGAKLQSITYLSQKNDPLQQMKLTYLYIKSVNEL